MQVRRSLTTAERAVASSNTDRRLWHRKSAYNPEVLVKVLSIYRTYFNYCEVGDDRRRRLCAWDLLRARLPRKTSSTSPPEEPARRRASPVKPAGMSLVPATTQ